MNSIPKEICIKGFIKAERHASPHIVKVISEILQNSLEANRIARSKNAKETEVIVSLYFNSTNIFSKLTVEDFASHDSGIHDIQTKQIFSLYNHVGENDGYSEFGIGGKQSCMQLGNLITYETKSNSSGGKLVWNISKIIDNEVHDYFNSITYSEELLMIPSPYKTGTKVSVENLESKFNSLSISTYLLYTETGGGQTFKDNICRSFVKIDDAEKVKFRFIHSGKLVGEFHLTPSTNICDNCEIYKMKIYNINDHETNKEFITTLVEHNNDYYRLYDEHCEFKRDKLLKEVFNKKTLYTKSLTNQVLIGEAELILSTYTSEVDDTNKDAMIKLRSEMGFDIHRRVKDGSIVRTNITTLSLQWNKFSSHRTRYNRFRGAIVYDKRLDNIVQTDKCKTVSDDRHFEPSFRRTILQLTDMYMRKMKEKGFYLEQINSHIQKKDTNTGQVHQILDKTQDASSTSEIEEEISDSMPIIETSIIDTNTEFVSKPPASLTSKEVPRTNSSLLLVDDNLESDSLITTETFNNESVEDDCLLISHDITVNDDVSTQNCTVLNEINEEEDEYSNVDDENQFIQHENNSESISDYKESNEYERLLKTNKTIKEIKDMKNEIMCLLSSICESDNLIYKELTSLEDLYYTLYTFKAEVMKNI
jgi:hypothetical protein